MRKQVIHPIKFVDNCVLSSTVISVKEDINRGVDANTIMKQYHISRSIYEEIRYGTTYDGIGPKITASRDLYPLLLYDIDDIGKLLASGMTIESVAETTKKSESYIKDIKDGKLFPEIREKYHLDTVVLNRMKLDTDRIKNVLIPALLSKKFHSDEEVAEYCKCTVNQVQCLRLHRTRKHLTKGIDFTHCYIK